MLGRKSKLKAGALADRMRRIAEAAPTFAPKTELGRPLRDERHASFRPGTLTFMTGERVEVVVTNISAGGARVALKRGGPLPERVMLCEARTGLKHWAYVTWQSWGVAGLKFVGASRTGKIA